MIEGNCLSCKKDFKTYKKSKKFCSFKCYCQYPKSETTRKKISVYIKNHPINPRLKGKAVYNYAKIEKTCIICGKKFKVSPALNRIKHCSRKCSYITNKYNKRGSKSYNWKGGKIIYTSCLWKEKSRMTKERDDYTCQICGYKGKNLIAHHQISRRIANVDELCNLVTLCRACHGKIEAIYSKIIKNGKIPFMITQAELKNDMANGGRGTVIRLI